MAQDNLIKMECGNCSQIGYYTYKNKKKLKNRLELKKYCKICRVHQNHKETK